MTKVAVTPEEFTELWNQAVEAANAAARDEALTPQGRSRAGNCGFAWITMPGNIPFARWAKKAGIARKGYPTGYQIWYSRVHSVTTQSISVHEAACIAARNVLAQGLQSSQITIGSRLD